MERDRVLLVGGYVLLAFWILFTIIQFRLSGHEATFWFCNIAVFFLVVACFEKVLPLFYLVLGMALFFETPWVLDWAIYFLSGYSFFSISELYAGLPLHFMVLTFIRHMLTVPFVIAALFLFKPERMSKKAILMGVFGILVFMGISYGLGADSNINCIHRPCFSALQGIFTGVWYSAAWTLLVIGVSLFSLFFVAYPIHTLIWKLRLKFF